MAIKREDDFAERRKHLAELSDKELKDKFWDLVEEIIDPLIEEAKTHTSQSIERSVLLRMGFNSLDARAIVNKIVEAELLGKGAGHVILKVSKKDELSIKEAGLAIAEDKYNKDELIALFDGGESK